VCMASEAAATGTTSVAAIRDGSGMVVATMSVNTQNGTTTYTCSGGQPVVLGLQCTGLGGGGVVGGTVGSSSSACSPGICVP
jgi:hypothetical protein